ncbi:hypothetical protein ABLE91_12420 [Aquabacter sp. CN5-332]|uniref:hypothetical protein n=1 Tax=Aquabacter sp. CN5-332 TaxID=3156608 RepID=UPI0032B581B8
MHRVRQWNEMWNRSDRLIKLLITGYDIKNPDEEAIQKDTEPHFATRAWPEWSTYGDVFGIIDNKASGLLTHISVMIAILTYMIGKWGVPVLEAILIFILIGYIVCAYTCLRCLRFWSFQDVVLSGAVVSEQEKKTALTMLRIEMFFRQECYKFSLNLTSALTVASVLLFIVSYFT